MYQLNFDRDALSSLKKLKRGEQENLLQRIDKLKENPYLGKRLSGNLFGLWRLRVDKYRILYKIVEDKLIIVILDIGHRKDVYD
ncbi:MAG: type II toxin-antitoxin system RelE/ParE family toxin [Candidatus Pacearchaeota archaeon]